MPRYSTPWRRMQVPVPIMPPFICVAHRSFLTHRDVGWTLVDISPTAAVAGVVVNGCAVYIGGAGTADDGASCADAAAAAATVFGTASISKTFIAALALQCAERGELNLDADINLVLGRSGEAPSRVGNPHFPAETQVTARQLLTHTAGLVDDESNLEHGSIYRWAAGATTAVSLAQYVQRELACDSAQATANWSGDAPPGTAAYHYSNAGFALLGLVIERAAGTPLPELARARLFHPLGMESTAYFLSELREERKEGSEVLHFAAPQGQPEAQGHYEVAEYPAAQVRSTVADLCRWLSFLTQPDREGPCEIGSQRGAEAQPESTTASRDTEERQTADHVLSEESISAMFPSTGRGALAWWGMDAEYSEKKQGQFEHGGFMQGVRTHMYVWPRSTERHACGCVVLLNGEARYEGVVSAIKQMFEVSKL